MSSSPGSTGPDPNGWKKMLKRPKKGVPEGLWKRCPGCQQTIFRKEAERRMGVCPECDYHWYVPARERIRQVEHQSLQKLASMAEAGRLA